MIPFADNAIFFLLQLTEGKLNHYLNVYSEFDAGGELDLNRIARKLRVQLNLIVLEFMYGFTFCLVSRFWQ